MGRRGTAWPPHPVGAEGCPQEAVPVPWSQKLRFQSCLWTLSSLYRPHDGSVKELCTLRQWGPQHHTASRWASSEPRVAPPGGGARGRTPQEDLGKAKSGCGVFLTRLTLLLGLPKEYLPRPFRPAPPPPPPSVPPPVVTRPSSPPAPGAGLGRRSRVRAPGCEAGSLGCALPLGDPREAL